jgi:hypothetical protein
MPSDFKLQDFDRVLIVEGYSDLHFYAELLEFLGKSGKVFIKQFNGKEDMVLKLETFITPLLLAEKQRIAVAVDADGDPTGAFNRLRTTLQTLTGQIVPGPGKWTNGDPNIGLFVTPDGASTGEIEARVGGGSCEPRAKTLYRSLCRLHEHLRLLATEPGQRFD